MKMTYTKFIFFSHNLVTYDGYVRKNFNILIFFLNFLKTFELDFDRSLQKVIFQKNAPIPSLYFFMVTRSPKWTNPVEFVFFRFFVI